MSKAALKKEMSNMTHEQVVQIMLDAYDANPEFKEYFEFFLNPNVERLMEKHDKVLVKELNRIKWGYSNARSSVIKKSVKKFIGFNPGPEAVRDMLFLTLKRLGQCERYTNFKEPLMNYVTFVAKQIVQHAEKNEMFGETIIMLADEAKNPFYTPYFKEYISAAMPR